MSNEQKQEQTQSGQSQQQSTVAPDLALEPMEITDQSDNAPPAP